MAELYHVDAIEKDDCTLVVRVHLVHEDEREFYQSKNWALQIIWPPANPLLDLDWPLGREVPFEAFIDSAALLRHADRLIERVTLLSTRRYPVKAGFSFKDAFERLGEMPMAELAIVATDARWLEHITPPQSWKSGAYDRSL